MKKYFGKIAVIAIAIIIGLCSASLTVYALYALSFKVDVPAIQTANYQTSVSVVEGETQTALTLEEEESTIESYIFSGEEGDAGVTFCITGVGTASTGYCEIIVGDETYYTQAIGQGESYIVSIKGNAGTEVTFQAHWGMHDITDEEVIIEDGETVGTYVPDETTSSSLTPSEESTEATEETTETTEESTEATEETTEATEESTETTEETTETAQESAETVETTEGSVESTENSETTQETGLNF